MPDDAVFHAADAAAEPKWPHQLLTWLRAREVFILGVAVAFQVALLLQMIAQRTAPLIHGQTVLLRVVPVDPRDMFRGDYVVLSYAFSRVPSAGIAGLPSHQRHEWTGRTVFVSLVPEGDGKHWRADRFSTNRPTEGVYLCGTVTHHDRIVFGIESFYVQEGTGRKYEQAIGAGKVAAEVAVAPDGRAGLKNLRIDYDRASQ